MSNFRTAAAAIAVATTLVTSGVKAEKELHTFVRGESAAVTNTNANGASNGNSNASEIMGITGIGGEDELQRSYIELLIAEQKRAACQQSSICRAQKFLHLSR